MRQKLKLYAKRYTLNAGAGFTLIELLVVIVIMAVVGTIVGSILFSSLRDSTKTSNINEVRTNGTYALSQMTKVIQGASKIDMAHCDDATTCSNPTLIPCSNYPCDINNNALNVTNFDGTTSILITGNKAIYLNNSNLNSSTTEIYDSSTGCYPPTNPTTYNIFTYHQNDVFSPPSIAINFVMDFKTSSTFAEQKVCVPFQTTVSPRNFGQ